MDEALGSRSYFHLADYIVCGVLLLASMAIGVYYGVKGGGQRTSSAYVLADRSMTVVPVTLSLVASLLSGVSLQGFPADAYFHGPTIFWLCVPSCLGTVLCLVFFMPMYYRLGLASAYEYFELRFNHSVKICGVVAFLCFAVMYSGLVMYLACVAANAVTGVSVSFASVILCAVCAVYTVIGGIKAVLWTDSLQMILMLISIVAVIIKISIDDGFSNVWQLAVEGSRTNFLYFNSDFSDFYNGWTFLTSATFAGFVVTNQYMVQRLVVCKSMAVARTSLIAFYVVTTLFMTLMVITGIAIYGHYAGCDPYTRGLITKSDQIVPFYILDAFSHLPGVPGLLLSGLFGAALSTLSSVLNAIATLIGEHFIKPCFKNLDDLKYTMTLKFAVVVASVVTLGAAFLVPAMGDAVSVIVTISACTKGSLLALFCLGAFCPFCGSKGALCGFTVGVLVAVAMSVGCIVYQVKPDNLPLSTELCANETYVDFNVTTLSESGGVWWADPGVANATPTTTTDGDSNGEDIPVIFTLAKSWLALLSFLTTAAVALLATLLTGGNDTSTLDPRLVMWNLKRRQSIKEQEIAGTGYTAVPDTECDKIGNEDDSSEAELEVATDGTDQLVEKVTAV